MFELEAPNPGCLIRVKRIVASAVAWRNVGSIRVMESVKMLVLVCDSHFYFLHVCLQKALLAFFITVF